MSKRKITDVYFYIRLSENNLSNYNFYYNTLYSYCENKKSLRIAGCFVEYCENTVPLAERIQLQRMFSMLKNTKYLLCCFDKSTISNDGNIVNQFVTDLKSQNNNVYFDLDSCTDRYNKNNKI
jgi:hypothetical protein